MLVMIPQAQSASRGLIEAALNAHNTVIEAALNAYKTETGNFVPDGPT